MGGVESWTHTFTMLESYQRPKDSVLHPVAADGYGRTMRDTS